MLVQHFFKKMLKIVDPTFSEMTVWPGVLNIYINVINPEGKSLF
jgi:hypothetical protein